MRKNWVAVSRVRYNKLSTLSSLSLFTELRISLSVIKLVDRALLSSRLGGKKKIEMINTLIIDMVIPHEVGLAEVFS